MALNPPIEDWHGKTVWLVGASTGIGRATAAALHAKGARVVVSARNAAALNEFAKQHKGARAMPLDASDVQAMRTAASQIIEQGGLDLAVYCAGHYNDMSAQTFDLTDMLRHNQINYVGALNMLDAVLPHFLARANATSQGHSSSPGHISLVSSVAGYRGLPKSLAYGPTKAALINLAETLHFDLRHKGLGVSVINPGFVETPLTAQNDFPMPALISPEKAAEEILRGWAKGEFEIHFPKRFTLWMKALQQLPYRLFFPAVRRFVPIEPPLQPAAPKAAAPHAPVEPPASRAPTS
jgi:NAD(P)-dependent dehydrogenase (short-subunit alcohol dehydrogenase family)